MIKMKKKIKNMMKFMMLKNTLMDQNTISIIVFTSTMAVIAFKFDNFIIMVIKMFIMTINWTKLKSVVLTVMNSLYEKSLTPFWNLSAFPSLSCLYMADLE